MPCGIADSLLILYQKEKAPAHHRNTGSKKAAQGRTNTPNIDNPPAIQWGAVVALNRRNPITEKVRYAVLPNVSKIPMLAIESSMGEATTTSDSIRNIVQLIGGAMRDIQELTVVYRLEVEIVQR